MFRLHKAEQIANGLENRIRYQKDLHQERQAKPNKIIFNKNQPKVLHKSRETEFRTPCLTAAVPVKKTQFSSLKVSFTGHRTMAWLPNSHYKNVKQNNVA